MFGWFAVRALARPGASCFGAKFIWSTHFEHMANNALFTRCSLVETLVAPHNSQSPIVSHYTLCSAIR